ncbi:imelysin family protein [Pelobium manganitolerans]|uniref:imelysin family protein n=1 Tax=Pelobium manganitolerans TaxID=1842495 RepID=UPI003FA375D8
MKTVNKNFFGLLIVTAVAFTACKKDNDNDVDLEVLQSEILANIGDNVCTASYIDMDAKAGELQTSVNTLVVTTNDANLEDARKKWKAMRSTWEQTESWLFGPVEANNIDPRIDTWPVDFNQLDAILTGQDVLNDTYVDALEDELKGFHPIEYLLWGKNGNKKATDFTVREKEYLKALTQNLIKLTKELKDTWLNGYNVQFKTAGAGSTEFSTKQEAFQQVVDAMAGICGEVADAKIKEPFDAADPSKEESPFAKNSFTDFQNNIKGIMLIYQGKFAKDGKGLEDLVRQYNLSLDGEIKAKHAAALAALEAFGTKPFGEAITTDHTKVQNAIDKIDELAELLDGKLRNFVLKYTK